MGGRPPTFRNGRMVAILLLLAIALTVALVIHFTRKPTETGAITAAGPVENADPVETVPADPQPLNFYLARADAARGEAYFSRCSVCHTSEAGGRNGVGPNLYGAVGSPIASRPDYQQYSPALRGLGGAWDYARLNQFLHAPSAFAPGTRMTFAGVMDPQDRADVMLYLNSKGGSLPAPAGGR